MVISVKCLPYLNPTSSADGKDLKVFSMMKEDSKGHHFVGAPFVIILGVQRII